MSDSNSSSSTTSSPAASPKPMPKSDSTASTEMIHKRTARMSTGDSYLTLKGKQLGASFKSLPAPPQKRRKLESDDLPDEDPEDDPDNEYGARRLRRNIHNDESDDDTSDDDSDDTSLESSLHNDVADESDEEELGDQDRHSPREEDANERDYNIARPDGDDIRVKHNTPEEGTMIDMLRESVSNLDPLRNC